MINWLTEILFPATLSDFMSWVNGRQFYHISSEDPLRWSHLFSWDKLGCLIARQQIIPADLRVFSNGRMVNPKLLGILDDDGGLQPMKIQTLMRQGASLAVSKIQGSDDGLWQLACDVERRLGDKTSITVIASFSSVSAMPLHYDSQDILILQIDGKKHWSFFGEPVAGSGISRPLKSKPTDVTGCFTLSPGDVLFVPSGQHHQCRPEGRSLHLAVLIRRLTGQEFVNQLHRRIIDDPLFDTPVPRGQGEHVLKGYERALKERLLRQVEEMSLSAIIQESDSLEQGVAGIDLIGHKFTEYPSARLMLLGRRRLVLPEHDLMKVAGCSLLLTPALRTAIDCLNEFGNITVMELRKGLTERHSIEEADKALDDLNDYGLAFIKMDSTMTTMKSCL